MKRLCGDPLNAASGSNAPDMSSADSRDVHPLFAASAVLQSKGVTCPQRLPTFLVSPKMVAHSFSTIISGAVRRSRSGGDLHAQTQRQPKQPGLIARSVEKTRSLFFATERAKVAP